MSRTVPRWPLRIPCWRSFWRATTRSPRREAAAGGIELVRSETALGLQELASAAIEVGDVVAAGGDHHRVALGTRPVVDQRSAGGGGAGRDGDPPVLAVGARPLLDLAATQRVERLAVPGLSLAADLVQLAGVEATPEGAEGAARFDLGQLAIVADQDELALDRCD